MFTNPCFIRKNTHEIRKKLTEMGLKSLNVGDTTLDAHNYDGKGHHKHIEEGNYIITYYSNHYGVVYDIDSVTVNRRIDCGTNVDLFLAIATLRDDTDKYQWFVDYSTGVQGGSWYMCDLNNSKDCFQSTKLCHKASVEELIEHFNK